MGTQPGKNERLSNVAEDHHMLNSRASSYLFSWKLCGFGGFPGSSAGKNSACNVGDLGLIPGLGRSPGEGKGYPLQYFGLETSMDCIVHGVAKSRTQLSDFRSHFQDPLSCSLSSSVSVSMFPCSSAPFCLWWLQAPAITECTLNLQGSHPWATL